jgi:phytoene dehydrogenase-like protein
VPLHRFLTGGVALVFLLAAHLRPWPVARGGSASIARALCDFARDQGVTFETNVQIERLDQLPNAPAILFDLAPRQVARIAGSQLPPRYLRALERYRMGPGVFKVDWALDGEIPWQAPECRLASTVHVGGRLEEVAASELDAFEGRVSERPFVMVTQQSHFDRTRAPGGCHTGYAYCHVPAGYDGDMTASIEAQIERFAPGFRERILARHTRSPSQWEQYNPSYIGGAITGGVADLRGFVARPSLSLDPYATPNPRLYICSHSTPPGGGVHGMCGLHAARSVLRRVFRIGLGPLGERLERP